MKINLENVNLNSSSGPNSFGRKVRSVLLERGHEFTDHNNADLSLCFIQAVQSMKGRKIPRIQRLDGIYYNTRQNYHQQNAAIIATYESADGVIYQSDWGRELVEKFFGTHKNGTVIRNGADMTAIATSKPINAPSGSNNVWSCAASWRPHKRLEQNIRYFLEHKSDGDILLIAGSTPHIVTDSSIYYLGEISQEKLYSVYKTSKYFLHLGWLDCCPNVVVDARACGAQIVCTDSGGTREVAGRDAIVIQELEPWDFKPMDLYSPPPLNFDKKIQNTYNPEFDMVNVAIEYEKFMEKFL